MIKISNPTEYSAACSDQIGHRVLAGEQHILEAAPGDELIRNGDQADDEPQRSGNKHPVQVHDRP